MESNIKRIERDIEKISEFTATPGEGYTRYSYSREDKLAREYLINEAQKIGLDVSIDGVGNIRAKYIDNNNDEPSIMIGSHIDTVFKGGKYDGVAGVVSALEVIRVIKEEQIKLKNPIELIIFAEEEGSNFGIGLLGSKFLTGNYDFDDLKEMRNSDGISGYQLLKDFGLNVDSINEQTLNNGQVKAMIELHVEQGGILESESKEIGIVEAIVGEKTFKVTLKGLSNHAGSTPMHLRKDALVGASEIIISLENAAREKNELNTVATVGTIYCRPNCKSSIPGEVEFYVDIRAIDLKKIEELEKVLLNKIEVVKEKYGLEAEIKLVCENDAVKLSKKVIDIIEESAIEKNIAYKKMNSGAVHDSVMLTQVTNVGMIFVPSKDGRSHCPEEFTKYEDIKTGCDLLLQAVIKLANE